MSLKEACFYRRWVGAVEQTTPLGPLPPPNHAHTKPNPPGKPTAAADTAALYAPDGVLWGTVSEQLRVSPGEILSYFQFFATLPNLRVAAYKPYVRVLGESGTVRSVFSCVCVCLGWCVCVVFNGMGVCVYVFCDGVGACVCVAVGRTAGPGGGV